MAKKVDKIFNSIEIKNIQSFYIDNINDKFFESLNNHPNRSFVTKVLPTIKKNLDDDEIEKLNEIDNLTKSLKIKLMLNLALKKIVSKTGSYNCDIFDIQEMDKFNEPLYIKNLDSNNDFDTSGNANNDYKYDFAIDINKKSYLASYISQIQLSFFFDEDCKMLAGGFSLNYEIKAANGINFLETIESIYLRTLIKHFIAKQLYPMSLNNMLAIIDDSEPNKTIIKTNKKSKKEKPTEPKIFENITIQSLYENWVDILNRKYLAFKKVTEKEKDFYENQLFFSMLTVVLINLCLYEELRIYFASENPEIILSLLDKPSLIKEDPNQNPDVDFIELSKFLKKEYFNKSKVNIDFKKIKTAEDLIKTLKIHKANSSNSFGLPAFSVELFLKKDINFVNPEIVFDEDYDLKMIYLLTICPEVLGMDEATSNFIAFKHLLDIVSKNYLYNRKITSSFHSKVKETLCENSYEYATFLSDDFSILILSNSNKTNNNLIQQKSESSGLYENYFWAQIFTQSRLWRKIDLERDYQTDLLNNENTYHKDKIRILEKLVFNWYDDYYGMYQIKPIVEKINQLTDLRKSIEMLISKIRQKDELSKKDKERKSIFFAYVVATLIGLINFFGMVYTVLTVQDPSQGLTTSNIVVISIGSVLAVLLFSIFLFFTINVIKPIRKEKKNKI